MFNIHSVNILIFLPRVHGLVCTKSLFIKAQVQPESKCGTRNANDKQNKVFVAAVLEQQ